MAEAIIPPPPAGFTLDAPPPPAGFTLDSAEAKPLTPKERLLRSGMAAFRGMPGGPLGVIANVGVDAMKQSDEALGQMAYTAGGAATDALAGKVPPEVAAGVGMAANVATQAIPAVVGGGVTRMLGKPLMEAGAKTLMQSAIKPTSADLLSGDAAKAIDTVLKEGINITPNGVATLQKKIGELHKEVAAKIAGSAEMVDKGFVGTELFKTIDKFKKQVRPGADVKAIKDAWAEFTANWGPKIPIEEAQAMKQGTQRILNTKYGEMGSAATEAEKSMARGLRLGIEDRIPEVAKLNAKESELINAVDVIQRRALLEGNKNITGLALLAHHPELNAIMLADRSALFKSILARMLHKNAGITALPGAAAGAVEGGLQGQPPP